MAPLWLWPTVTMRSPFGTPRTGSWSRCWVRPPARSGPFRFPTTANASSSLPTARCPSGTRLPGNANRGRVGRVGRQRSALTATHGLRLLRELPFGPGQAVQVRFSSDNELVAVAGYPASSVSGESRGGIVVWNVSSGRRLNQTAILGPQNSFGESFVFSYRERQDVAARR